MGGKGGSKIEVNRYLMSIHSGLCIGPVDAITRAYYGEKLYWSGYVTDNRSITIKNLGLFGGEKKEGGIEGTMTFLLGKSDQVVPDFYAKKLGRSGSSDCPGFRGVASVLHSGPSSGYSGWYWCANSPYLKSMWYSVVNIPVTLESTMARIGQLGFGKTSLFFCLDNSGSMDTNNRIGVLKAAMSLVIENLKGSVASGGNTLDIGVGSFEGGTRQYVNATSSDLDELDAWIQTWTANEGTNFLTGINKSVAWFNASANDASITRRVNIFITDGEPSPVDSAEMARDAAAHLLDRTIDVDMYAFNIDLEDTHYTAMLDNTSTDGVPVITSDDQSALLNAIMTSVFVTVDCNPAHIIYYALTDSQVGMGLDPALSIDVPSFVEAAETLFKEGLGLSLAWTTSTSAEDFINEIKDHINGVIFPDPSTGKMRLKLIRDDYSAASLREVNEDNAKVTSFSRKSWGDTVNEIVVTWTNPKNEQEETVTLQDNGNIAEQGEIISDSKNYYGVRSAALAWRLADRDLRVAAAPLCSVEVELDRSFWDLRPGDCVKMVWPEYGIANLVMRVWEVKYGSARNGSSRITASMTEDIFSLPTSSFVAPQQPEWQDTSKRPEPIKTWDIITVPAYMASKIAGQAIGTFDPDVEYAGVLAADPNGDTDSFDFLGEQINAVGALEWVKLGTLQITGHGVMSETLAASAQSLFNGFGAIKGGPSVAGFVMFGTGDNSSELALVTDIDPVAGVTIKRGVLDTTPKQWDIGTRVWFIDSAFNFADQTQRVAGLPVRYKLLPNTTLGQLNETSAVVVSGQLTDRLQAPLRPANVKVAGTAFGEAELPVSGRVNVEWVRRNRVTEETIVLGWTDPDVTPEPAQTTTINVVNGDTGVVDATFAGETGLSTVLDIGAIYPAFKPTFVRVEVLSVRDGIQSVQSHSIVVNMPGSGGGGDDYRVSVTIPAMAENMPGFPVYIDLRTLPVEAWSHMKHADGGDIRVKTESGSDLPFDLVQFDRDAKTGFLFARMDLSSTDPVRLYVHYGLESNKAVDPTEGNGRYAVWAGYDRCYTFGGDFRDRTGSGKDLIGTYLGNSFYVSAQKTLPRSLGFGSAAIYAEGRLVLSSRDTGIERYDYANAATFIDANTSPIPSEHLASTVYFKVVCQVGDYLYAIIYKTGAVTSSYIGVYNKTTLAFVRLIPVVFDSGVTQPTNFNGYATYNETDGLLYFSFTDNPTALWKFDLATEKFVGRLLFSSPLPSTTRIYSVTWRRDGFYVSTEGNVLARVEKDGTVRNTVYRSVPNGQSILSMSIRDSAIVCHALDRAYVIKPSDIQSNLLGANTTDQRQYYASEGAPTNSKWTIGVSAMATSETNSTCAIVSYTRKNMGSNNSAREVLARRSTWAASLWNLSDGWVPNNETMAVNRVYRLHATHDSTVRRSVYLDGVVKGVDDVVTLRPPAGVVDAALYVGVGEGGDTDQTWVGNFGFVYLHPTVFSDARIAAETANLNTPTSFYSVGPEEAPTP